jgi:hypothetical protein
LVFWSAGTSAIADVVSLLPLRDNTLYESVTGALSNGAGNHFFAGSTNASDKRRGLILFDIAGNVPAEATIDSVELTLFASRVSSIAEQGVSLHRTLANWGAAGSHAIGEEGMGAPAMAGDATWRHTFFNTGFWTNDGGDFAPTASATRMVGGQGPYTWTSTPQTVADVQAWLDNPASNFGWTLVGDESNSFTAKRFDSLEGLIAGQRPLLTVNFTPEPPGTIWNVDADANWSAANNWTAGIPDAAGAKAVFGGVITAARTVTVDTGITVGRIEFNNANAYTIAGANTLTLDATSGDAKIMVGGGSHTISAAVTLADNTAISVAPATGQLSITGALNSSGVALAKAGAGSLRVNHVRAAALAINDGSVIITPDGGNAGTSAVGTLSVSGSGRLDLNDNDLVVRATAGTKDAVYDEIEGDIASAQNGVDANFVTNWNGPGITSSTARASNVAAGFDLTAIGVVRNSDLDTTTGVPGSTYTTFSGQAVTPDDVLVKYTYTGDGNLDGAVTFDDYAAMDSAFFGLIPNLGWATGDINFDGEISFDDYSVVDQAFFFQGEPLTGEGVAAVPEPGTWLLAAFCGLAGLLTWMRR